MSVRCTLLQCNMTGMLPTGFWLNVSRYLLHVVARCRSKSSSSHMQAGEIDRVPQAGVLTSLLQSFAFVLHFQIHVSFILRYSLLSRFVISRCSSRYAYCIYSYKL